MHQLTSLDAQFLAAEDGRTHGHGCALGIYDPASAPAWPLIEHIKAELAELRGLVSHKAHRSRTPTDTKEARR